VNHSNANLFRKLGRVIYKLTQSNDIIKFVIENWSFLLPEFKKKKKNKKKKIIKFLKKNWFFLQQEYKKKKKAKQKKKSKNIPKYINHDKLGGFL